MLQQVTVLAAAISLVVPTIWAAPLYRLTTLEPLPGWTRSAAFGLNDAGQVVGNVSAGAFNVNYSSRAVVWRDGTAIDLGWLTNRRETYRVANAINNAGQIAGTSNARPFLYSDGAMTALGSFFGTAMAINESGQVVGEIWDVSSGLFRYRAYQYSQGVFTYLGQLPRTSESLAYDINNAGQIVGENRRNYGDSQYKGYAVLYDSGEIINLATDAGFRAGRPAYINDVGQIIGLSLSYDWTTQAYEDRAALFTQGSTTDLGLFPGDVGFSATGLNNAGQVVGFGSYLVPNQPYWYRGNRALLYHQGGLHDLRTLVSNNAGWELTRAEGINNRGQIVGQGIYANESRGFLLTPVPVPEPGTAVFLGTGLMAVWMLARLRHRRSSSLAAHGRRRRFTLRRSN